MLTIFAFWLLVLATAVTVVVVYRPRGIRTIPAVVEPRSHVRPITRERMGSSASVVALGDRRRSTAARHTA